MLKKFIITAVIVATATSAMARDITVTFANGSQHQYLNTPNSVTPEQIMARTSQDFPTLELINIDGGNNGDIAGKPSESNGWSTAGKIVVGLLLIGAIGYGLRHIPAAKAYPCMLPTDRAKDGSLCGGRASSVRPGGR